MSLANGQIGGTPTSDGSFSFGVTVTDSAATPASTTSGLSMTVRPNAADLVLSSSSVSFAITSGTSGAPPASSVSVSSSAPAQTLSFSTAVAPSVPWLTATGGSGTPGSLSIGLSNAALSLTSAGSPYSATVVVTCTSNICAGRSQSVAVLLTVTTAPPQLSVGSALISFTATTTNPQSSSASLDIQNSGGGALKNTTATSDSTWLTVGTPPASILPGPGGQVAVTANPAGLSPGYYRGTISVSSSAGNASVPVTLLLSPNSTMTLSQAGTQLSMPEGGALGKSGGNFLVSVNSGTPVGYSVAVQPGANWLVASGTGNASNAGPGTVNYSVNPTEAAALTAGAYYGSVRVTASGIVNSPQDFQVILNVSPAGKPILPDPQPAGLLFITTAGGSSPPPQLVTLFASSKTPLSFQAAASVTDGSGNWLSAGPATGTTSASTAVR